MGKLGDSGDGSPKWGPKEKPLWRSDGAKSQETDYMFKK